MTGTNIAFLLMVKELRFSPKKPVNMKNWHEAKLAELSLNIQFTHTHTHTGHGREVGITSCETEDDQTDSEKKNKRLWEGNMMTAYCV